MMTETIQNPYVLVAVLTPFVAAMATFAASSRWTERLSLVASVVTAVSVATLPGAVRAGEQVAWHFFEVIPGVALELRVDALGVTFACLAAGLWVVTTFYSIGYTRTEKLRYRRRYFGSFSAAIGTALGVAFAGNLLTFLVFYEFLTLSTWPLVAHNETREAVGGGRRYLVYTLLGGLSLTVGTAWCWLATGQLDFSAGGFVQGQPVAVLAGLFALLMFGCGIKAAIMPMHAWLPAAMVAPTPVSALLHAVAVVKAGVFGCLRILGFVFGPEALRQFGGDEVLIVLCMITIVAGSMLALRQDHLKRRLAFSTVVHLSYIVLGGSLLSPLGMVGAVLYMVNHGLAKITLFFCAGAIHANTHYERISQFKGLGRQMPWTFAMFTIASLSLVGIPGLCGFIGKLYLARGAAQAELYWPLTIIIGASLLTAAYLFPVIWTAFFEKPDKKDEHSFGEARLMMVIPLAITAALSLVFGLVPLVITYQLSLARDVAAHVFGAMP